MRGIVVGIRDIAERAGVSKTTVSHVLNGTRHVRPETAARVQEVVDDLGYKPNMLARSLRRKKTHTIGLLVSDIENPFFTRVARAVETTAYERDYNLILCNTDENLEKEILYTDVLFAKQVDGLIVAPAPGDHSFLLPYLDRGEKVVFINRTMPTVDVPAVVCDDEVAIYSLAKHFLDEGYHKLGAIIGLEGVSTTENRLKGLEQALSEHGQTLAATWLFPGSAREDGGRKAAEQFVALQDRPQIVIAFNSIMLDGFLVALQRLAPDALATTRVSSHGRSALAQVMCPSYSFVEHPVYELGRRATTELLDSLSEDSESTSEVIVLENRLVHLGRTDINM